VQYPKERSVKDAGGIPQGVAGDAKLLNKKNLSTQPICSFDWCEENLPPSRHPPVVETYPAELVWRVHGVDWDC
jgi:hypothetical protein